MRITFKKQPLYSGQMRLPASYHANLNGKQVATIQAMGECHLLFDSIRWFWYGDGINTAKNPATLDECKQQIKDHFNAKAIR